MDLFRDTITQPKNLLPKDGIVKYYGILIPLYNADHYFARLLSSIQWKNDEAIIFGKHIVTKRKVAWYADDPFEYTYSNTTKRALPWTNDLLALKVIIENKVGETFNSCLLNLYHNGSEGMAWHSDGEKDLKKNGTIASLSFGVERKFSFKHKSTKETLSIVLEHGSLLVMAGTTQTFWQHRLPTTKKIHEPRINLTFRNIECQIN
ncbi:MAG: alpha-ketoglutarate-dependent dioxygenase AlkB [Gammaproteobacteria bacterium]|nr:alpha-ketoglutarate-dependent dioxygenase AlkB [Gammaproteobacteria bacterium]